MRKILSLLLFLAFIAQAVNIPVYANSFVSDNLIAADDDFDDWDDEDWDDWDDDDWDDADWEEEEEDSSAGKQDIQINVTPAPKTQNDYKQEIKDETPDEVVNSITKDFDDNDFKALEKKLNRSKEDIEKMFQAYGDQLKGLDPSNPEDLNEIEKLIEIVGVPKRKRARRKPTKKVAMKDDPLVNFSARNIPVRDAFATLARVSGKSITVSGQIQDRDTVSVVEISDQPFTKAFLSLVEAADVDFSASGDNFTILKKKGQRTTSLKSGLDTTDINLDLPLEDRYADLIYDNEDLASIIKDLANKYGVDVVMTATPTERITLRVRGVNIEDAFELIFSGSQFSYTRKDDTFVVYSAANKNFSLDKKTVLFPLKYLEAQEAQKLLPEELKNLVQVSENQNAFIAEGSKSELTKLYEFIRTIDKPVPQVELNVKLVEVTKSFTRTIGLLQNQFSVGRIGNVLDAADAATGISQEGDGSGRVVGFGTNLGSDEFSIFQNRPTYSQSTDSSQIKVNQRLLVTSGKSAKINFDEDINVLLNAGDAAGGGVGVVQNQRIQRVTAGNSMDITPIVGGGGVVTVKIDIEVSVNDRPTTESGGVPPRTVRRRLSSEVQINNHETIAIGGLFDNRKGFDNSNELPILSKIPVIGQFFSNGSKNKGLTELIILITPHLRADNEEVENIYIHADAEREAD
jgi:type II secretory pathway component GspD/PulD (secretin)